MTYLKKTEKKEEQTKYIISRTKIITRTEINGIWLIAICFLKQIVWEKRTNSQLFHENQVQIIRRKTKTCFL